MGVVGDLRAGERRADSVLLVAERGEPVASRGILCAARVVDAVRRDDAQHDLRVPGEDLVGDSEVGHAAYSRGSYRTGEMVKRPKLTPSSTPEPWPARARETSPLVIALAVEALTRPASAVPSA